MRRAECMDGRHPEAVRLTLTTCADRRREAELNIWYDRTHIPDVLAGGVATHGTRVANADPESANPAYLALYELSGLDLEQIQHRFADLVQRLHRDGRMLGDLQIVRRSMWRRLGGKVITRVGPYAGPVPGGGEGGTSPHLFFTPARLFYPPLQRTHPPPPPAFPSLFCATVCPRRRTRSIHPFMVRPTNGECL